MSLMTPYLEAIQAIPGDTPTEKYRWISKMIKDRIKVEGTEFDLNIWTNIIGQPLIPLVKIIAGNMLKKYDVVTEALKSEDMFVVSKALKARWYFDGHNKKIVNVDFFFENILPYVSMKVRARIIKSLSCHLGRNHPKLAEKFFMALSKAYGIDQSIILLRNCSESFIYDIVVRHRIVVSSNVLKKWYLTKPNLVIRYLKLDQPMDDPLFRNTYRVSVHKYIDFLPSLIKYNLKDFIEIFERYESNPPVIKLKIKCADMFLKKATQKFLEKPKLFINMLPLKLIDSDRMDIIFPKLMPKDRNKFNTNQMLKYLEYYPDEKKAMLFLKSYKDVYKKNLFDDLTNVTDSLLCILPIDQRITEARRLKSQKSANCTYETNYKCVWRCYLPTNEIIPTIISEVNKTKYTTDRVALIMQIIYSCKINQDDEALFKTLEYINVRHKNEDASFWSSLFEEFRNIYDLSKLSKRHWIVINEIIERNYVMDQLCGFYSSKNKFLLESAIRFRMMNDMPLEKILNIFVDVELQNWEDRWIIFNDDAEYQRRCFDNIVKIIVKKFETKDPNWEKENKLTVTKDLLLAINNYNVRHAIGKNTKWGKLSLKNYPWLMEQVRSIITNVPPIDSYLVKDIKRYLKNDEDLYKLWMMEEEIAGDIDSGNALAQLKRNPEFVLKRFSNYLDNCEISTRVRMMKRFITRSRWYKDIPIKFAEEAMRRLRDENKVYYLQFLGMLLYGKTYAKIIDPYIPKEKMIDIEPNDANNRYKLLINALRGIVLSDPPVPIEIIARICESDYLLTALQVITNVCDRTSISKIKLFAKDLTDKRVSVKKHGIRLICRIETLQNSSDFLLSQLKEEKHYSIREIIITKTFDMFKKEPGPITWLTLKKCISEFKLEDWQNCKHLINPMTNIPTEYIFDFIHMIIKMAEKAIVQMNGVDDRTIKWYIETIFGKIDEATANILPDDYCEKIIEKYLFNSDYVMQDTFRIFTVNKYLLLRKDKLESRFAILMRIFFNAVRTGWNMPHPKRAHFYPINYTLRVIIHDIISHLLSDNQYDLRIIHGTLKLFNECLTPEMDITSYFLLIITKEYIESKELYVFALKLCDKIPELVCEYSPLYPTSIIDALQHFFAIIRIDNLEEMKLIVIENLIKCPSIYAQLVAVSILPIIKIPANIPKYDALVNILRNSNNATIRSILYTKINAVGFYSCTVDQ
ncbi:uncharacterized protein LOC124955379 isoform X1 [Vespa velutina]|uniref:uncharacterized protein LOC124955379 isoform X1 n=1 Tax=Vespa velutina TaxID=202808 RepID=UPI001FB49D1A|nr:uncharacterized protein LOC124955379 isoform X1 [Vespa velutina]XP_047365678.1 uncharacterized protein LOC124955379 isoform X1 [Vespa velutina]XP_047365679.1 uncharacterized protein LOC124955379 isoform X1 [Vespa velutina]